VNQQLATDYRAAREVRKLLLDVYGAASDSVVLAPGTLAGLRLMFGALDVQRVTLSAGEYFDEASFPAARVDSVDTGALVEHLAARRPDAVLLSVVTWKGERLPVEGLFEAIRAKLGAETPLLVADFSHAGAAGFPKVTDSGADIVAGDATKWITPPDWADRVAYLWFRTEELAFTAKRVFAPFYLALARPSSRLAARWMDPDALAKVVAFRRRAKISRHKLRDRFRADIALATRIAKWCGAPVPSSSLVWIKPAEGIAKIPKWAKDLGLLWQHPPGGGVRVMCRSDLAP
jgi:hypothetical protein